MSPRRPTRALASTWYALGSGALLGGLLACASPGIDRGSLTIGAPGVTPPAASASATAGPVTSAPVASSAAVAPVTSVPGAVASAPATMASALAAPIEDERPGPALPSPSVARGQCTGRSDLHTAQGDVSCYPYRCRAGRCLLACAGRQDCAGSDGPADLAENGWPLDCARTAGATGTCYPLHPRHVTGGPRP